MKKFYVYQNTGCYPAYARSPMGAVVKVVFKLHHIGVRFSTVYKVVSADAIGA